MNSELDPGSRSRTGCLATEHTPSIAFRHLPPKDIVNQCLESLAAEFVPRQLVLLTLSLWLPHIPQLLEEQAAGYMSWSVLAGSTHLIICWSGCGSLACFCGSESLRRTLLWQISTVCLFVYSSAIWKYFGQSFKNERGERKKKKQKKQVVVYQRLIVRQVSIKLIAILGK